MHWFPSRVTSAISWITSSKAVVFSTVPDQLYFVNVLLSSSSSMVICFSHATILLSDMACTNTISEKSTAFSNLFTSRSHGVINMMRFIRLFNVVVKRIKFHYRFYENYVQRIEMHFVLIFLVSHREKEPWRKREHTFLTFCREFENSRHSCCWKRGSAIQ